MPEGRRVDVQLFLNEHPFSGFQWTIFALCFAVVLLDGFDTAAIGYIAPSLLTEWGIPRPALAPVLSAALFGLVVGQGCSTLWDAEKVEEVIEAADGGAEAILGEGASAVGLEDVEGEAAE